MRFTVSSVLMLASLLHAVGGQTATPTNAGDMLRVLDQSGERLLHEFLLGEVARQYAQRRLAVAAALASPESVLARRDELRKQYRRMLGEFPARTPLNARTIGTIPCDGYRIERVRYESRPGHHVTANLYLPEGATEPVPGVLVPCGHSANGKASEAYQSVCVLLASNGFAALIYDPIGQGERNQILALDRHGTTEHTLVGAGALLVGWNTATYRVWDGLRSMDYLAGRPEVDPNRLGCTGNSGGGTMTTWPMAIDERIAAAAPSCFITSVERVFNTIGPQDCEQHFASQGAYGIEHTDFVTMRAPKPTLILAAQRDFFDIDGTRTAHAEAADIYRALGKPEQVGLFAYDDEHGFSQPRRQAAVGWMRRWLLGDDRPVVEPRLTLQKDQDLQVTVSGQVLGDFAEEVTVVELANERAAQLAESRRAAWNAASTPLRLAAIKRLIALPDALSPRTSTKSVGRLARAGYSIDKLLIERSAAVPLPALLFVPDAATQNKKRPAVLYADGRGKAADAGPGGPIEKLVKAGNIVLSVDLRGYGETTDSLQQSKYRNDEFRTAMLAFHVGRPLVGQRVEDVLAALGVLAAHHRVDPDAIHLVGVERAGPVALHAAAIEPRFASVTLRDSIRSWKDDVVAKPLDANLLGQVVPGALAHYDLPDVAAMLGDRLKAEPSK